MTFGERLINLRKENGFNTRSEFADKLGIPSTTLRNYEKNEREPGHTFLKQVSELFNVSVDYLLCLTNEKEVLNSFRLRTSEQDLIEKYRTLDRAGQEHVNTVLCWEYDRAEHERKMTERLKKRISTYEEALKKMQGNKSQKIYYSNTQDLSVVAESPTPYMVDAAHERTDIEVTDEMLKHDNDIKDDDSEWE